DPLHGAARGGGDQRDPRRVDALPVEAGVVACLLDRRHRRERFARITTRELLLQIRQKLPVIEVPDFSGNPHLGPRRVAAGQEVEFGVSPADILPELVDMSGTGEHGTDTSNVHALITALPTDGYRRCVHAINLTTREQRAIRPPVPGNKELKYRRYPEN